MVEQTKITQVQKHLEETPQVEIQGSFGFWEQVILVCLSVGTLNTIINLVKEIILQKINHKRNIQKQRQTIENVANIYDYLQKIQVVTKSDSVCICRVSNGGNTPQPNKPLYLSILYEIVEQSAFSVKELWQQRPISRQVFNLVEKTYQKTEIFEDDRLPELEEIIAAEELEALVSIPIGKTEKEFYFLLIKYQNYIAYKLGFNEAKILGFINSIANLLQTES